MANRKKIGVCVRDPGSANIMIAMYPYLCEKGYEIILFCKAYAYTMCRRASIPCKDINQLLPAIHPASIGKLLESYQLDLVITGTSLEDDYERYVWEACNKIGLASYAFIDQWMNIEERFGTLEKVYPQTVLAIDMEMRKTLLGLGLAKNKIKVIGHPYFEYLTKKYKLRFQQKSEMKVKRLLFLSQPIWQFYQTDLGYTEYDIFKHLLQVMEEVNKVVTQKVQVVLRLHPKEDRELFLEQFTDAYRHQAFALDKEEQIEASIEQSDYIVSMFSTGLLEGALMGKPILSIQLNLKEVDRFILGGRDKTYCVYQTPKLLEAVTTMIQEEKKVDFHGFLGSRERFLSVLEG